ncbi:hypothetical protein AGMMS49949_09520 [Alphaproteobacteria bacterium]|nr:hypothetical protein AGMMS49949_09520 [Alphaproteobacteria bacterium]
MSKMEGIGATKYHDGNEYTGGWRTDLPSGQGVLKDKEGNILFKGNWIRGIGYVGAINRAGLPYGKGIGTYQNGARYEGNWVNGAREGMGMLTESDGRKYVDV